MAAGAALVAVPWLVAAVAPDQQRYVLHILVFAALFGALALSYDLAVGHVGSLSLAHPAFFGIGAYTAALLATRAGWPFAADVGAAIVLSAVAALLIGGPAFRLAEHSFAIGTLGFAMVTQIVATNWVEFTRGPLCVTGIPRPAMTLVPGLSVQITTLPAYYWLALGAVGVELTTPGASVAEHLVPYMKPAFVLRLVLLGTLGAVLAALYPAWRASRLDPVRALASS